MISLSFLYVEGLLANRPVSRLRTLSFLGSLILIVFCAACGTSPNTIPIPPVQTYSLSGQVTPAAAGNGATATLSGAASGRTTADSSGNFSFTNLSNGNYAITPSKTGYVFTPPSQPVAISGANVTGVNFTGAVAPATYMISGSITPASVGAGATVTLSGSGAGVTSADANGSFSFTSLSNGTYTITPSSTTATFSPTSQSVTINGANVTGVSFTATATSTVLFFDDFTGNALDLTAWTVISRHGEYAQNETECNIPQQVSVANSLLTITAAVGPAICGDFNPDGSVRTAPSSWPYITGDVQWNSLSFTYGTVTIRGAMPAQSTSLWPAFWLLGNNCQNTNKYSGDTGFGGCPNLGQSGYTEIDMVECYGSGWCQFHLANPSFGIGNGCDATYPVDTNFHVFQTVWTPTSIKQYMDGVLETTCNQSPSNPMFLIIQIQTGGAGGMPNNALLPATQQVDFVRVTQP